MKSDINTVNEKMLRITIEYTRWTIHIFREIIKALRYPEYISIRVNADWTSFAIVECKEKDWLSFKVREDLYTTKGRAVRICSKEFILALMYKNDLSTKLSYTIPGEYVEKNNAVVFQVSDAKVVTRREANIKD